MLVRRSSASSNENRATDRPTPRSPASSMARARSRPNASALSRPVRGSSMPLDSIDLSRRLSRASKARSRTSGTRRSTSTCGSRAWTKLGSSSTRSSGRASRPADRGSGRPRRAPRGRPPTIRGDRPSPITMPSISRALRQRAARSTLSAPITPMRSPTATLERRMQAAAADHQHGGVLERIAGRQLGDDVALGHERAGAAQHGRVQRAQPQRRREPRDQPLDRRIFGDRQRIGERRAPSSRVRAIDGNIGFARRDLRFERVRRRRIRRVRLGQHHGGRLDRGDRARRIGPARLDHRERAGGGERLRPGRQPASRRRRRSDLAATWTNATPVRSSGKAATLRGRC